MAGTQLTSAKNLKNTTDADTRAGITAAFSAQAEAKTDKTTLKSSTAVLTTLTTSVLNILDSTMRGFDILCEEQNDIYTRATSFADTIDTIAQYTTEAVAGQACMGSVQKTILNMFRDLPGHYVNMRRASQYEQIMGLQANFLITISTLMGNDATEDARTKLTNLHRTYTHWEAALIEINYALTGLADAEDDFLDHALNSTLGTYGTAGAPDNPVIGILNRIRTHSETVFNETRKAEILWDVMEEKLVYYKNAIKKMAAPAEPPAPQAKSQKSLLP